MSVRARALVCSVGVLCALSACRNPCELGPDDYDDCSIVFHSHYYFDSPSGACQENPVSITVSATDESADVCMTGDGPFETLEECVKECL